MAMSVAVPTPPRIDPDQVCNCLASETSMEGPAGATGKAESGWSDAAEVGLPALRRAGADVRVTMSVSCLWLPTGFHIRCQTAMAVRIAWA
jgi:hypothetical protein